MVTDEYRPYIGGAGRCMELFAQELSRLGHTVAIATAWHADAPAFEDDGQVQVHRIRDLPSRMRWISEDPNRHTPPPFPDPEAVWRLRRLIKRLPTRPDPRLRLACPLRGGGLDRQADPAGDLGARVRERLRDAHHGPRHRDLLGPRPVKCLTCSAAGRGVAEGDRGGGERPRRAAAASAQDHCASTASATTSRTVLDRDLDVPGVPSVVIPNFHVDETDAPVDEEVLERLPEAALHPVRRAPFGDSRGSTS